MTSMTNTAVGVLHSRVFKIKIQTGTSDIRLFQQLNCQKKFQAEKLSL